MENREQIVPTRFDSRDVLAGLRAVEETGQVAGDLGQTADAASARFRRAHESIESALQDFDALRRSLGRAPGGGDRTSGGDPAAERPPDPGGPPPPEDWPDHGAGLRGTIAARLGGSAMGQPDEKPAGSRADEASFPVAAEPFRRSGTGTTADAPGHGPRPEPGETGPSRPGLAAGPDDGRDGGLAAFESPILFNPERSGIARGGLEPSVAMTPDDRPGPSRRGRTAGDPGTADLDAALERSDLLADVRPRPGFAGGGGDTVAEPGGAGRISPEAIAGYLEWMNGGADGSRGRDPAIGGDGMAAQTGESRERPVGPAIRDEPDAWRSGARPSERPDPREGLWRARAASMASAEPENPLAEGRTTAAAAVAPGDWNALGPLGAGSTAAIERLLREQNELIRQDLQRSANPPIAAPPPLRGGGLRM